jgi:hypothetical protein
VNIDEITHVVCCDDPKLALCGVPYDDFVEINPTCVVCSDLIGRPFCPKQNRCKEWDYLQ